LLAVCKVNISPLDVKWNSGLLEDLTQNVEAESLLSQLIVNIPDSLLKKD